MYAFADFLKKIREEGGLTQVELARILGVSTMLISLLETRQKEVSKAFIVKLAEKLEVRPSSISPFAYEEFGKKGEMLTLEKTHLDVGARLQEYLIRVKAKKLKNYV